MNKINRKLEYSLMALKHMSSKRPGQLTTAKEVSETYSCPFDATARVMQKMAQAGLLKAELGAHGGYQITKDLAKVTMHDLIRMVLGPLGISKCLIAGRDCEIIESCNIVSPIRTLNQRLSDFYKQVSLLELLQSEDAGSSSHPEKTVPRETHQSSDEATG